MLKMFAIAGLAVSIAFSALAAVSTPDVGPHAFASNSGAMRLPAWMGGSNPSTACLPCKFLVQR